MRRLWIVVFFCAALLLTPKPAHAWWGWWDEMSGPGPWMFVDVKYRIACIPDPEAQGIAATRKDPPENIIRALDSFDGWGKFWAGFSGAGCILQPDVHPRASINASTAFFVAVANNPRPDGAGRLAMQKYEVTASAFLDKAKVFEAHAGAGVVQGLGKSEFTRGYWTVTGTITPWAAVPRSAGSHSLLRTIAVNVGVIVVPKGFAASDFAAPNHPFRTEGEILKTISITLDFSRY